MLINKCKLIAVYTVTWHIISVSSVSHENVTGNLTCQNTNEDPGKLKVKLLPERH